MKRISAIGVFLLLHLTLSAQDSLTIKKADSIPLTPYYYKRPEKKKFFFSDITPGINLHLVTARGTAVDFNPYASKQISSRFSFGIGWNHRISFRRGRGGGPNYVGQLFGPRLNFNYNLSHGFTVRVIPDLVYIRWPRNLSPPDQVKHSWEWSVFAGVRKDFKISKRVVGYLELLYDVASSTEIPLYGDKVNLRLGFELNKRKR